MKIKRVATMVAGILLVMMMFPTTATAMMDLNADPTPVVSSGSFICKTWGGTTMDSFNVGGGSFTAASFSRTQGEVIYNLSGYCDEGEELSLDITGSQFDMTGYSVGLDDNRILMSIKYLNASGDDVSEAGAYDSGPSKSASLSGSIAGAVPAGAVQVVIKGTFTCTWSSAYAKSAETVGVYATFAVGEASVPVPTTSATTEPIVSTTAAPVTTTALSSTSGWWPFTNSKSPPKPVTQDKDPYHFNPVVRFGDLHGEVNVKPAGADDDEYIFVELDTPLKHGDTIRTLPGSGAILSWSDMSTTVIGPDTVVVLDIANERDSKIGIVAGRIWVNLKKMVEDGSMEVEMAQGVCGIKGTILAASVTPSGDEYYLFTSSAEITSKTSGEKVMLRPGQKALVNQNGDIQVGKFDVEKKAKEFGIELSVLKDDGYEVKNIGWILGSLLALFLIFVFIFLLILKKKRTNAVSEPVSLPSSDSSNQIQQQTLQATASYCPDCGQPAHGDRQFCEHCGKSLK